MVPHHNVFLTAGYLGSRQNVSRIKQMWIWICTQPLHSFITWMLWSFSQSVSLYEQWNINKAYLLRFLWQWWEMSALNSRASCPDSGPLVLPSGPQYGLSLALYFLVYNKTFPCLQQNFADCDPWSHGWIIQGMAFQEEAILDHTDPFLLIRTFFKVSRLRSKDPSDSKLLWCPLEAGLAMSFVLVGGSQVPGAGGESRDLSAFCTSPHSCLA